MESFDVVIVGAGIHGISVLKTYLEVNPVCSILLLEKSGSLGGVWSKERLYPTLRTNNHFGTFEFSDYPMDSNGFNPADDHIPGEYMSAYMQKYAWKFNLVRHMRFNCNVVSAVDEGDCGWDLTLSDVSSGTSFASRIKARKLVIATGLTSEPAMPPPFEGHADFGAPIYHTSEFANVNNGLGPYKSVVVLSGAKSSWDVAYAYASSGVQVDWIIRESGHGPCWMMPNRLTPLKIIPELLLQIRLITWLSPCIFPDGFGWIRRLLHGHWLGRKFVDIFFGKIEHSVLEANDYDSHPETSKLKPWQGVFFLGTNRGLLNYPSDIFELVRNGTIRVHISDISKLSRNAVHLADGTILDADVLICGTGWKTIPPIRFESKKDLGLPGRLHRPLRDLEPRADAEIFQRFPKLKDQPQLRYRKVREECVQKEEPYRLYRFMVPPAFMDSRTLAVAGAYRSPATIFIAQAQALWITAFLGGDIGPSRSPDLLLDKKIPVSIGDSSTELAVYETMLHTQFSKWRYSGGFGACFPELWFDCLPYVDLLLSDVGVKNRRKKTWWQEVFTPYEPTDYNGIVEEFILARARQ